MLKEEGRVEQAIESARLLFQNGVDFAIVRTSIPLLSDETLKEIYNEVNR